MAKIVLGKRPQSFKRPVSFTMVDGDIGELTLTFKYRTKREFAALIDGLSQPAAQAEPAQDAQLSIEGVPQADVVAPDATAEQSVKIPQLSEFMAVTIESQADYILKIAEAWDLDAPFDREHVIAFCDEQPGGALAVMSKYREAITEGRLGN